MRILCLLPVLLMSATADAKLVRKPVPYEIDGAPYEGVLVYDDAVRAPRPGLLLVPNWLGVNEDNLVQAAEVAGRAYVVFVADVFGTAVRPKSPAEASAVVAPLKADRAVLRKRVAAAREAFRSQFKTAGVDAAKEGAIGFCFGGTAVLELAKSGADVRGVVSFHGGLDAVVPTGERPKARILALHGADDPFVPAPDVQAFKDDLRNAGADWTLVEFGGAVHSFTDRKANVPRKNQFDPAVAARAYRLMNDFFSETFAAGR
ncbi:MAG: dienelactone hydrolase family protein [Myxococcales bacterium]